MDRRGFIKSIFGIAAGAAAVKFLPSAKAGTVVWGTKTVKLNSSLDRINCRRLLLYIKQKIEEGLKPFMFEPNDTITRSSMKKYVTQLLKDVQKKDAMLEKFKVICDETNNNPTVIDSNSAVMDVYLKVGKLPEDTFTVLRVVVGRASYQGGV